ncbi:MULTISPECIES: DUF6230 family protein [Cryobacterium]|uniref:Cholesterol esterase n=1 Tax=Cryobacterium mannosilyticum TaxID=1259190 RepID=A0A4V3IDP6_9MICO|nr:MULTISPECIES: DUF6230 family protein [Cryobacterium]MBG6057774.1 hypothetical protein [Cryobacterium sp. MP_M3]MEC5175711.1 hypothetical protein [Cryobacterium sp. MP_M5]TFC07980.1 cholesterol esterase [Cryobacterium mannosilyticum]
MKFKKLTQSRPGRITLAVIPVTLVMGVLMTGVAQGAVPVAFAVSGSQFQIGASKLDGTGFSQYAGVAVQADGKTMHPVAIANIDSASLTDLCQSVVTVTPLGTLGLLINAGGGGNPAQASALQLGMTDLQGDATFTNIRIGVDASKVNTAAKGTAGDFAQDADHITINGLKQTAWSTQAGTFALNGLHMQITNGTKCF